jgi:GUN4-like/NACHT domain
MGENLDAVSFAFPSAMTQTEEKKPEPDEKKPEKKAESSSLPEQLAELAIKVLKPGGVGVGGAYGLWLLVIEHKSGAAIASALIGFCFSYAGKLLEPIHEGNQRRLGKVGKLIDGAIDQGFTKLKWLGAGCTGRYLERQGERCKEYYGTDNFKQPDGIWQVNLNDVFVPLNLDLAIGQLGAGIGSESKSQTFEIWDFLAKTKQVKAYRFMAILADGGSGKTTLLRHITYKYAEGKHRKHGRQVPKLLPFLLFLRKWRDVIAENPTMTLADLMMRHLRDLRGGKSLKVPDDWAENQLKRQSLIMFDGFDEVAKHQRQAIAQWISQQVENYPEAIVLLTSRPGGYDDFKEHATEIPTALRVREFEKAERDTFIQKWYLRQELVFRMGKISPIVRDEAQRQSSNLIRQVDASVELKKMSGNPLLLNLIARLHRSYADDRLPQRKTELYQEICDLQLGARPMAKRVSMLLDKPIERQQVLQHIALELVRQNTAQIGQEKLLELLKVGLATQDESIDPAEFLKQMVQISELLYEPDAAEYAFSHLSFRNYLAALEIERRDLRQELVEHWHEDWWRETILIYSSRLKPLQVNQLVEQAIAQRPGNVNLAYDCLVRHPSPDRIAPEWIAALQPARYQKLETFMQEGKWREADIENYRLMIQTCGKDYGENFTRRDLETFPCWDLLRLDGLWVQYSGGKFGFSVQKPIWESCGSPKGYDLTDDEYAQWLAYATRCGWYADGDFLSYDALKKNPLLSPAGEFPGASFSCRRISGFVVVLGGGGGWLCSRAETCGL